MGELATGDNVVARQYEKWVYPQPIMDLSVPELRRVKDRGDPDLNFHTYWPDRPFRDDLDILIAGCGSNAAARYALNHPNARVVGIDFSASSLAHEAYLKQKHGLDNLTLHHGRLEDVHALGLDFDFIEASGVLHHLPDPVRGLQALGSVLRPDGIIAVMVYGKYGRTGVYMLQEMFRLMELGQSEDDVAMVKQTLAELPKRHCVHGYVSRAHDCKYDAGLVDTFLHRQDRAYTVAECLDLVAQADMKFMGWWDNILYYPEGQLAPGKALHQKIRDLPDESIWQLMELYNDTLGQHSFCLCHSTRAESSFRIDFGSDAFMNSIPVLRCKEVAAEPADLTGRVVVQRRPWPKYTLDQLASALFRQIDGTKSVRECFEQANITCQPGQGPQDICRAAFRYLWRLSYIFLRIPA